METAMLEIEAELYSMLLLLDIRSASYLCLQWRECSLAGWVMSEVLRWRLLGLSCRRWKGRSSCEIS